MHLEKNTDNRNICIILPLMRTDEELTLLIGITIEIFRMEKNWTQEELANKVGSDQRHIARIENGSKDIRISTLRKICKALGVTVSELYVELDD